MARQGTHRAEGVASRMPRMPRLVFAMPRGIPLGGLTTRIGEVWAWLRDAWLSISPKLAPVTRPVGAVLHSITPVGWTVLSISAFAWLVGWALGWVEPRYLAAFGVALVLLSGLLTLGRMKLRVTLDLHPQRVVVGSGAAARVSVVNDGARPVLPLDLDLPVGQNSARFHLPTLSSGDSYDEPVIIPTHRRGVIVVGPLSTGRGDPLGLVSRRVTWTEPIELFVHPKTVPVEPVGSGLLRDLEGHSTNDISMTDLAFHTLREYAPGDDRRYIHWRSSAKLAGRPTGTSSPFLVRQFLDTRRSHVAVIVDCDRTVYAADDDFELAVSAGASVAVRAVRDQMDLSVAAGRFAVVDPDPPMALDVFSRAELAGVTLSDSARELAKLSPDISVVVMATGSLGELTGIRHAASFFPPQVNVIALQVEEGASAGMASVGSITVLTLGRLAELPIILHGGQSR